MGSGQIINGREILVGAQLTSNQHTLTILRHSAGVLSPCNMFVSRVYITVPPPPWPCVRSHVRPQNRSPARGGFVCLFRARARSRNLFKDPPNETHTHTHTQRRRWLRLRQCCQPNQTPLFDRTAIPIQDRMRAAENQLQKEPVQTHKVNHLRAPTQSSQKPRHTRARSVRWITSRRHSNRLLFGAHTRFAVRKFRFAGCLRTVCAFLMGTNKL